MFSENVDEKGSNQAATTKQEPAPAPALPDFQGRGLAAILPVLAYAEGQNDGLVIVPVELAELKEKLAAFSSQQNKILAELYTRFKDYRDRHFPGMLDIIIAIEPMNNKVLAHYQPKNGFDIPHVITFNEAFIALNYSDKNLVELDRDIVGHVLLHEMIHHYQTLIEEVYKSQQSAHGRSFRREAKRVGVEGVGRLMKCPYPVKMPESARKAKKDSDDPDGDGGEGGDDDGGHECECHRPHVTFDMVAAIQKIGKDYRNKRFGYEVYCKKVEEIMGGAGGLESDGDEENDEE